MKFVLKTLIILSFSFSTLEAAAGTAVQQRVLPKKSAIDFTQGYAVINKKCPLFERPAASQALAYLSEGKRLWLTAVDSQWLVATTKQTAKEIFIPKTCIN